MKADDRAEIERGLEAHLEPGTRVSITGVASVGAQRRTLFLDLDRAGASSRAVAQITQQAPSTTDVETEAALLRAVAAEGVRAPRLLAVAPELGAIVSEHVAGESIPRRILRLVEAEPTLGERLTRDCAEAMAAIHRVDPTRLPDPADQSDPLVYAAGLEEQIAELGGPHPSFRLGLSWLRRNAPAAVREPVLVHGDFRLGNILASERGLEAVLDWELAHLGDPMEDLAWICLRCWRFGNDAKRVGGFGRLADLREAYEKAGGRFRPEAFAWWTVARTLWWGLGLARQARVHMDGLRRSIVLAASGRRVVELEYDLLMAIAGDAP